MPIIKTSNHDIFYVDEGDGFPIFLIHGLAGDHKAWLNQIEYFKNNYNRQIKDKVLPDGLSGGSY